MKILVANILTFVNISREIYFNTLKTKLLQKLYLNFSTWDFLKPLISVCKLTMNRNGKSEIETVYNSDFQFWFIVNYFIAQRAEFYSYDGLKMSSGPI